MTASSALTNDWGALSWIRTAGRALLRSRHILPILLADGLDVAGLARQLFALGHAISLGSHLLHRGEKSIHLHAHFLGRCLDVVTYTAIILGTGVTTSATGHAADARNVFAPRRFRHQVRRLDSVFCASESVAGVLEEATGRKATAIIHCGITPKPWLAQDRPPSRQLRILTVARLVEKKGLFDCLLAAQELHKKGVPFEWRFIGDGPLLESLKSNSQKLTDQGCIVWMGVQSSAVVHQQLEQWADIFVLPSKVSTDGDVDGIPVALMEAMTSEVAVVSSRISGIPELIAHRETGLLIEPGNLQELISAVESLQNPKFRAAICSAAKKFVDLEFNQNTEAGKISSLICKTPTPDILKER